MLLTLTTTHRPATDLGFLLHKNPASVHTRDLAFGPAHVVWPEADDDRATAALIVEIDPIALVRGRPGGTDGPLAQYVNDRPYAASSFLSVALAQVFREALGGRSKERPELARTPIPLEIGLPVLPCRGGERLLRDLFEPLGWQVEATRHPRDPEVPAWGDSALYTVVLRGTLPLSAALSHLYVLVPVLDDDKHYWVGDDEVDKLLLRGEGWLADHPCKDAIALRYLKRRRSLADRALQQLVADAPDDEPGPDGPPDTGSAGEAALEAPISLQQRRIAAVMEQIVALDPRSVADLGCGEGQLVVALLKRKTIERVLALDVSPSALDRAARKLKLDRMPDGTRARLELAQGALGWRDPRIDGVDVACLIEVIEHLEPDRLPGLEGALFGASRPTTVIVTTPNAEYNARFPNLPPGAFRHGDHRFEWDRETFEAWARGVCDRRGYTVSFTPIGDVDPELGAPTQMAVFTRVVGP